MRLPPFIWSLGRTLAGVAPAFTLFLLMAHEGISTGFFPDEMMNIYLCWKEPWPALLRWNLTPFEWHVRPAGALFYRPLFDLFALNPLPYRCVCFFLLLANLVITYRLLFRLTSSPATASAGTLLISFHAYLTDLYYSSATVYDILCYSFYLGALLYYSHRRGKGRLDWRAIAALLALHTIALNAKEMAMTLPILLLAYELLYIPRGSRDPRGATACGLLAALSLGSRLLAPNSLLGISLYVPGPGLVVSNLQHYFGMLTYAHRRIDLWVFGAGAVLLAVTFWLGRRRPHVLFGGVLALVTPLPVLMIAPRSLYVFYIPMAGWALLAASLLTAPAAVQRLTELRSLPLSLCLLAALLPAHIHRKPFGNGWVKAEQSKVRQVLSELTEKLPTAAAGSRILILDDPFEADDFILTFLFRLKYHDDSIDVVRLKGRSAQDTDPAVYDYVADLSGWRLQLIRTK